MATFHVHRIKTHAIYSKEDAVKYGLEKACILYEIGNSYEGIKIKDLHKEFPFIEEKKFYVLLNELIEENLLMNSLSKN